MAEYRYEGVDRAGKKVSGSLQADDDGGARFALRGQGIRPTKLSKSGAAGVVSRAVQVKAASGSSNISLGITELVGFTRQLQVLISSGVPLVQALGILADQSSIANMRTMANGLRDKVGGGAFFWESLAGYPRIFPKLYVALVRAGESSGAIDQMLKRLTRYLEDTDRLRKMIKGAMFYPAMVIAVGVLVVGALLYFVIPKFEELLTGAGQELPAPTKFVIDLSHFLANNIVYIVVGIVLGSTFLMQFLRTEPGRAALDRFIYRLPFFGTLAQKGGIARFSRTMQTLLSSGVNLVDAIDICTSTISNVVIEDAMRSIRSQIEQGKTLAAVIEKMPVFPKMAVQMIAVGESTGNLDKMLDKVADYYEADVEVMVSGISKMIEPFILVFLGGAVGGLLIAMYLPIFKIAGGAGD